MKKNIILLIFVFILVFTLCGCTNKTETVEEIKNDNSIKVGFIYLHDEQSTYDLNFLNAAKEAGKITDVEIINKVNIPEGQECYDTAAELVDEGCTLIFADSFGHEDYMIQAAQDFPNVEFCHATGTQAHTLNKANFHNAFASIYEGRYLAGIAAGMKLNEMIANEEFSENEALIGYVGAHPYAEVISGYTSFFLGARSVCPTARMQVIFTGTWYDEALEKEAATSLIKRGCKLISQHADSMGAPTACESAKIPNVSYNGSTIDVAPNTFIISSKIDWTPYFVYIINCLKEGKQIDTDWTGTIETGSVVLTDVNQNVAAKDTLSVIEKAKSEIVAGNLHVFDVSTFTVNNQTIETYKADVNTDENFQGDTEVIADGYFHESQYRSAPYFDLNIDGIEIIGE